MSGFDPAKIGYQRIYKLKKLFDGENDESTELPVRHSDDEICMYSTHPYIRRITRKQISMTDSFFAAAYPFREWHIDKILDIFCLPPALFSVSSRLNLRYRIINHEISGSNEEVLPSKADPVSLQICRNYMDAMKKMADEGFDSIRNVISSIAPARRKKICDWIASLPADPEKEYTVRHILKRTGISKSSYYAVLKDPDHGTYQMKKELRDKEDAALIRQVMEHGGFKKGTRQVYMQMKALTGRQFGINKIRRLKNKFGITSGIRKTNRSRQSARELLKRNVKPNLLKRQFRLARPNRIRLTDVTYLNYGGNKRAYASAVKDPVTGKLVSFVVSESNDLALAQTSLEDVVSEELVKGALFHSDQGALYLNDTFQRKVLDAGLEQSMSKRGNCWDNAPQESFFGHFKQECPYEQCDSVEELHKMLARYMEYYNNERK
ncbi:MAG: IS3 family transposase, partial [Lachnospiraceae bacterium]|nr:IS3 family transposase [Lachnospiraceae bacterium]